MTIRIFVLLSQYDIIDFRLGHRPANMLVRDFETEAEAQAYRDGVAAIGDEYVRIESLDVVGSRVTYTRRLDDPEAEPVANDAEMQFATPAEADAFSKGVADAEGFAAPLLIDDTDDRFEQLQEWSTGGSD